MEQNNNEAVLCYIEGCWAWFTTQALQNQWGDDWDDAPYECNAEEPYEPCWHNDPEFRNNPSVYRRMKPGTKEPLEVGELCQCKICKLGWNEDGTPKWRVFKVAFDGNFSRPCDGHIDSPWSIEQINAGAVAWLVGNDNNKTIAIQAGTTFEKFCELIMKGHGIVYMPYSPNGTETEA